MADSAQTIVTAALREIRVLAEDETPSPEQSNDGLNALNDMLEVWSIENILTYVQQEENFPLSAGVASYTIGPGGVFNTVRPSKINYAYFRDSNNLDTNLGVIGPQRYGGIVSKSLQGLASVLTYTPSFPLGLIRLANVPQQSATLYLQSDKTLGSFPTLATAFSFPPGYKRALVKNLAVDRAPSYGKTPKEELKEQAISSKDTLRRLNLPEIVMTTDAPGANNGRFNIYTGGYT